MKRDTIIEAVICGDGVMIADKLQNCGEIFRA